MEVFSRVMHSDLQNRALEAQLVGHWTCADEREICEYAFLPQNEFTCLVKREGESPFKVRGYWAVMGGELLLGPSPLANEPARIVKLEATAFSAETAGRHLKHFARVVAR